MRRWIHLGLASVVTVLPLGCGGQNDGQPPVSEPAQASRPAEVTPTATEVIQTPTAVAVIETPTTVPRETAAFGISEALNQTAAVTSARLEGSIRMTGIEGLPSGAEFSIPFSGEFDNETGVSAFRMDMSKIAEIAGEGLPPGFGDLFGEMEIRTFGDVAYMKFPFFSALLGAETEWVRLPADDAGSAAGGFSAGVSPSNPTAALDVYADAEAEISDLGGETVRGVQTTHYLVLIDVQKLLETATPEERAEIEAQGPLPFDELPLHLWISDDGLVYRYVMEFSGESVQTAPGEGFDMMTMTFEIFDYGAAINVEEPPASQVTDAEELGGLIDLF
jgi:hypothetical protein